VDTEHSQSLVRHGDCNVEMSNSLDALMLLVGRQKGQPACKKWGGWWRWALVGPDGVAPRRIVCVSASVTLILHHKVQKFSAVFTIE